MSQEITARHALPLIAPGQAQKELSHNEALTAIDMIAQPYALATNATVPPTSPAIGECWLLGISPTGAWAGQAQALACWTVVGWRFAAPVAGMEVRIAGNEGFARFVGGAWHEGALTGAMLSIAGEPVVGPREPAIDNPVGGTTADDEARDAIAAILATLRTHGLIEV